jgi:signal transduction histidine kinase
VRYDWRVPVLLVEHQRPQCARQRGSAGFGLAIVRDLAELYGGTVSLGRAARGGRRAELRLPA